MHCMYNSSCFAGEEYVFSSEEAPFVNDSTVIFLVISVYLFFGGRGFMGERFVINCEEAPRDILARHATDRCNIHIQ